MLPRVKIIFENGALAQTVSSPDGVFGLLLTGVAVAGKFVLATPYTLRSLASLTALGITVENNPHIIKVVTQYYAEAGEGAEVWLMAFPDTVKVSQMVDVDSPYGKLLINAANGRLRALIVSRSPDVAYAPVITNGLDADLIPAMLKGQALCEWSTDQKFAPIFLILEGYAYSGNAVDLADLTDLNYNRVSVMIGDVVKDSKFAAVGMLAGRLSKNAVQVNIAKVKDGALSTATAFIKGDKIEVADVASIHDKGYITMRTYVGRSGYFFNDDFTATLPDDDYSHLTARRTIDKAYRIAYDELLEELMAEVPVNADGTLQDAIVKSWQVKVESAIASAMTARGELSADVTNNDDKGVICFINSNQNIVSSSLINVSLRVRPFGYTRYFDVYLGFQIISN